MKPATWLKYKAPVAPASPSSAMGPAISPELAMADPLVRADDGRGADPLVKADDGRGQFGGKGGEGVWQTIINQIPPHKTFIEAFAGSATITRFKRPATSTIVIDADAAVCRSLIARLGEGRAVQMSFERKSLVGWQEKVKPGLTVRCDDATVWLDLKSRQLGADTVVYCDPPYLFDVRSGRNRKRYGAEFGEQWQHTHLLEVLIHLDCHVLISGYRHELYDQMLSTWRRVDYVAPTRRGTRIESLWCNFDQPTELHDSRFFGRDFRERERVKRKKARWVAKLKAMSPAERAVLLEAIKQTE